LAKPKVSQTGKRRENVTVRQMGSPMGFHSG
jgi:hypothetical protein